MGWLDLHMHSNKSNDGDYEPKKLIQKCKESGLKVVALSDHNSVRGVEEAVKEGARLGIEVISGVELDCRFKEYNLHLLGYGIQMPNIDIENLEQSVINMEQRASILLIEKIQSLGIFVSKQELWEIAINDVITGEMIAEIALKDQRNSQNKLLEAYKTGGSRDDNPYVNFYWDYCSKNKPAYVPINYIDLKEGIQLILRNGGIPILAHPGKNIGLNEETFKEIIEMGVVGVEVYSSYHGLEEIKFFNNLANKYSLCKTMGSDFHGKTKPSIHLGEFTEHPDEEIIYQQLKQKLKNSSLH